MAIPSSIARRIVDELIRFGQVIRPDCGIFSVYEVDDGLLLGRLVPGGPAERAGLRGPQLTVIRRGGYENRMLDRSRADLILAVDDHPVKTLDDLLSYIESEKAGDKVVFRVVRDGTELNVQVVLVKARN
jgi:S1-C subfamily serine protease